MGQKPSFESQGPPPPPTSQYYAIHPPYMPGGNPFTFDQVPPGHMYRNMMVPYNSAPYHLQMPRFHSGKQLLILLFFCFYYKAIQAFSKYFCCWL